MKAHRRYLIGVLILATLPASYANDTIEKNSELLQKKNSTSKVISDGVTVHYKKNGKLNTTFVSGTKHDAPDAILSKASQLTHRSQQAKYREINDVLVVKYKKNGDIEEVYAPKIKITSAPGQRQVTLQEPVDRNFSQSGYN